jgi:hypothetical protein
MVKLEDEIAGRGDDGADLIAADLYRVFSGKTKSVFAAVA